MSENVLFVCVENAGRSQMAEAFLENLLLIRLTFLVMVLCLPLNSIQLWFK